MKNWIERYLYQIEKKLPLKNKKDLIEEIKSNLYDELEATYGSIDPSEEEILLFLQNNESPSKIASAYRGFDEALIGGSLYPLYLLIVKIALLASLLGITIATIVSVGFGTQPYLDIFGNLLGGVVQAAIGAVGSVTIIFALIQRLMDPDELKSETENWNPKELPAVPEKKNELKRAEPIIAIVFLILLILGFNFFPDQILQGIQKNPRSVVVPVINTHVLKSYLPWLNMIWGSALVFNIILLIKNQWTSFLRLIRIGLDWAGLILFLLMISNPDFFAIQGIFQWLGVDGGASLDAIFRSFARVGILFIIALTIFESGKSIYKIVRK